MAIQSLSFAQIKTNFEIVDSLISVSVKNISLELNKTEKYNFEFNGADEYKIFQNKVSSYFVNDDVILAEDKQDGKLVYTLNEAKCNYSEVVKEGFFSGFLVNRKITISGAYSVNQNGLLGKSINFKIENNDLVPFEDISRLENIAYPFASAEIPEEPFFSSVLEPAIAIGTAAVAIYLFFNIRSK